MMMKHSLWINEYRTEIIIVINSKELTDKYTLQFGDKLHTAKYLY